MHGLEQSGNLPLTKMRGKTPSESPMNRERVVCVWRRELTERDENLYGCTGLWGVLIKYSSLEDWI